uniref:hypothetical protein n=1 Tax=Natronorubrum halophilum TaxID=1702106 RepID=UPI00374353ED
MENEISRRRRRRGSLFETAVKINGDWSWSFTAIDSETNLILDVALFGRNGTDSAAVSLQKIYEKHDLSGAEFLVGQFVIGLEPLG